MATLPASNPGAQYHEIFEKPDGLPAGGAVRNGGRSDRLRDRLVREEIARLARQGVMPATVYNLHRRPLKVCLGELGEIIVPAASGDTPGSLRIERARISMRDLGDGNFTPVSVLPKELALEVEREYEKTGGVYSVVGDSAPSEDQRAAATAARDRWLREEYRAAVDSWARLRQHKAITDPQREAARELHRRGEIPQLPDWVVITNQASDRTACPECGEEIKRHAKVCRFCQSRWNGRTASEAAAASVPAAVKAPEPPAAEAEAAGDDWRNIEVGGADGGAAAERAQAVMARQGKRKGSEA